MGGAAVHLSSLDGVAERVLDHVRQGHHTVLVGSPGCGMTTFVADLVTGLAGAGYRSNRFDSRTKTVSDLATELSAARPQGAARQVVILDHATSLSMEDYKRLLAITTEASAKNRDICVWCGNVDARGTDRGLGTKLCSVPSAHITFPVLSRDELLSAYRYVSDAKGCRWGDAVLYLMLDLCGTDLRLVNSITDHLHGDWSDRLYDDSVWDRIQEWLKVDEVVDSYRSSLAALREECGDTLALIRFGGKPRCARAELIDESDDGLRKLCLKGFLIPNLLPGFYQLRSLVVRFLLDESVAPEVHLRRATNERAAALLQDAETMLRQVLTAVFARVGLDAARTRLQGMQVPGEVIEAELNRALITWAREKGQPDAVKELNELLLKHRQEFKKNNSAWEVAHAMMRRDKVEEDGAPHLQCLDYLTLDQLGRLVLGLIDQVFPRLPDEAAAKRVKEGWQEAIAKVARLRNQVAHLRNVGFQDMEDLARTLERMRRDVIDYGGWQMPPSAAVNTAVPQQEPATAPSTMPAQDPAATASTENAREPAVAPNATPVLEPAVDPNPTLAQEPPAEAR